MFGMFRRRGRIELLKAELRRAIEETAAAVEECDRETDRAADLAEELEQAWRDRDAARAALAESDRARDGLRDLYRRAAGLARVD